MPHISHDAHNAPILAADQRYLADRILSWPDPPRHLFIDHDNLFAVGCVALSEVTPRDERNTHRADVAMIHHTRVCDRRLPAAETHATSAYTPAAVAAQRQRIGDARRFDTWNRLNAGNESIVEQHARCRVRILWSS